MAEGGVVLSDFKYNIWGSSWLISKNTLTFVPTHNSFDVGNYRSILNDNRKIIIYALLQFT